MNNEAVRFFFEHVNPNEAVLKLNGSLKNSDRLAVKKLFSLIKSLLLIEGCDIEAARKMSLSKFTDLEAAPS